MPKLIIDNIIEVEFDSESVLSDEPASIRIIDTSAGGGLLASIKAKVDFQIGADGDRYPVVSLEAESFSTVRIVA